VQGQPLDEYDDDKIPEPKTTTKYIEARSDEMFSIMTVFKPPFPNQYDVGVRTCIDGVIMNTTTRERDEILQRPMSSEHYFSCQGGEWVKQKFTFAKLNIGKYYEGLLTSSTYSFAQWKRLMNLPLLLLLGSRLSAPKVVSLYRSILSKLPKRQA